MQGAVNRVFQPCDLYWLQIKTNPIKPLAGNNIKETELIFNKILKIEKRTFSSSSNQIDSFKKMMASFDSPSETSTLKLGLGLNFK